MLSKKQAGVLLVALLAVVAGCSTGGGGDGGTTVTDGGDGGAGPGDGGDGGDGGGTTAATTSGGTTSGGDGGMGTTDDGGDGATATTTSGGTTTGGDGAGLFSDYGSKVEDAGGFVAEMELSTEGGGTVFSGNWTIRQNLESGATLTTINTSVRGRDIRVEQYRPPGSDTIHQCTFTRGECMREQTIPAGEASSFNASDPVSGSLVADTPNVSESGTVDTEYGTLTRYSIDSIEDLPESARSGSFGRYEEFSMEILVEPDTGLVRRITMDATVSTDSGTSDLRLVIDYVEYGPVTVEAPDWYDG